MGWAANDIFGELCTCACVRRYEQNIAFAAHYATALNAHALLFNYRGVCESEGWPYESEKLAMDGRAAVGYVMTTYGTPEDHILLHGHSLGGGVVAKIAAEFPQYVHLVQCHML